jgi:hypothetical protein
LMAAISTRPAASVGVVLFEENHIRGRW